MAAVERIQNASSDTLLHWADRVLTAQSLDEAIFRPVSAGGMTEANLQAAITNYVATEGVRFHQETGLFAADIANMFRAAQLRRHLHGRRASEAAALMDPARNPDIAANISALGLSANHLERYLANPNFHGEHRAGFVTRALFTSEHGQKLRNAMTDNGGVGIGRLLVSDNFNLVVARAPARGVALSTRQRAQVTMRVHNQGAGNLDGYLSDLNATAAHGRCTSSRASATFVHQEFS